MRERILLSSVLILVSPAVPTLLAPEKSPVPAPYFSLPADTAAERRERAAKTAARLEALTGQFKFRTFTQGVVPIPYRLYQPKGYQAGKSYPLAIFFHGSGGQGTDNRRHIVDANYSACIWALPEFQSKHECFIVAPQLQEGITTSTWRVLGQRAETESAEASTSPAGDWRLTLTGYRDRTNAMRLILQSSAQQWTGSIRMVGRQDSERTLKQIVYTNQTLRFAFGLTGNEQNHRVELQFEGKELRGTFFRNTNPSPGARDLIALIDSVCAEFSIDRGRIYATGLSMGGGVTWALTGQFPEKFAATVPVCGMGSPDDAPGMVRRQLAIWTFHGADDRTIPAAVTRTMLAALREAGGNPRYTEYPGVDHNSWIDAYQDPELHDWLFRQRRYF